MPMDRSRYPDNWEAIALQVKESASWACQQCGQQCLQSGEEWLAFLLRLNVTVGEAATMSEHPTRYVLTTAHLNHDPENPDAELRAWCAPCHCRYDLAQMGRKRRLRLEREGQLTLEMLTPPEPAGHGKEPSKVQIPLKEEWSNATNTVRG
ncbi:HNH endonuclease [Leptolyngbya sp. AN02str]|uniref:HNH endonuclease n=1 Tax=Leptolyngbya sp. AN02str TaxID=3423363 RepID=UPI003D31E745